MAAIPSPSRPTCRALGIAVRHLNAPLAVEVEEQRALEWIRTRIWTSHERPLVHALLDETDPETLIDLVIARTATYEDLALCADVLLPVGHRNRTLLEERRHVGLA